MLKTITRSDIATRDLGVIEDHAAKLNRQIKRTGLDLEPVTVEITDTRHVQLFQDGPQVAIRVKRFDITITAPDIESIVRPGYRLAALAQATQDGVDVQKAENRIITRMASGEGLDLSQYRTMALRCEECNTKRQRNTILVLIETATDRLFAVGTDCAEKYIPRPASSVLLLESIMYLEEIIGEGGEDPWAEHGGRIVPTCDRDELLRVASIWTKAHPYIRASETGSTKEDVLSILLGRSEIANELRKEFAGLEAEQDPKAIAKEIKALKAWVKAQPFSDYIDNLQAALADGITTPRTFGLVISAPHVYRGSKEREQKQASQAHYGTPGERFGKVRKAKKWNALDEAARPVGSVLRCQPIESYYGTSYKTTIQLDTGELLVWWSTNPMDQLEGCRVKITATIKKHDTWKGEKQTIINRAILDKVA